MAEKPRGRIGVLAGTNGGGKSSVGGALIRSAGDDYFNPDEAARSILRSDPLMTQAEANARAWRKGVDLLKRAIARRGEFVFETTLGGATITEHLRRAASAGLAVEIWYVALASPELHLERIRKRARASGDDNDASRANLIALLPSLRELRVFDNSRATNPPSPMLLLHTLARKVEFVIEPSLTPDWAKPIIGAALHLRRR